MTENKETTEEEKISLFDWYKKKADKVFKTFMIVILSLLFVVVLATYLVIKFVFKM